MALNFTTVSTEVKSYLGKVDDTILVTTTRVQRWVNDAQRKIVRGYPGLRDVDTLDKHTWKCQAGVFEYDLADFDTVKKVAHLLSIRYVDIANKDYQYIRPYDGGLEKWERDYPYPPDAGTGKPERYQLRGNKIEFVLTPGDNEDNNPLWVQYSYLPDDMTGTDAFDLVGFDEEITQWAISLGLKAMRRYQESREMEASARLLVEERWQNELAVNVPTTIGLNGP